MQSFEKRDTRTNEDNTYNDLSYPKKPNESSSEVEREMFWYSFRNEDNSSEGYSFVSYSFFLVRIVVAAKWSTERAYALIRNVQVGAV